MQGERLDRVGDWNLLAEGEGCPGGAGGSTSVKRRTEPCDECDPEEEQRGLCREDACVTNRWYSHCCHRLDEEGEQGKVAEVLACSVGDTGLPQPGAGICSLSCSFAC